MGISKFWHERASFFLSLASFSLIPSHSYSAGLKKLESRWKKGKAQPSPPPPTKDAKSKSEARKPADNHGLPNGPRANAATPSAPKSTNTSSPAPSTPSGPRSQLGNTQDNTNGAASHKSAFDTLVSLLCLFSFFFQRECDSIPRPQLIKRTNRDSPKPAVDAKSSQPPSGPAADRRPASVREGNSNGNLTPTKAADSKSTPTTRGDAERTNGDDKATPGMPPPAVPSQTMSAQELRETAKQTMHRHDRAPEAVPATPPTAPTTTTATPKKAVDSVTSSPRRRSPSPQSRPGTRNHSTDSRASGGKTRSTKDSGRQEPTRRDSLTHVRSDRPRRESERDDRDRDRGGRDRHGDGRDSHRERERERDHNRDRHRRDEKDRKDRPAPAPASADSRRVEDSAAHLGKRRRPGDDDVGFIISVFWTGTHIILTVGSFV